MFASFASTVGASFSVIGGVVLKRIILRVLNETKRFFDRRPGGIAVGTYVAPVKRRRIICAILARTLCARDAQKMLTLFV